VSLVESAVKGVGDAAGKIVEILDEDRLSGGGRESGDGEEGVMGTTKAAGFTAMMSFCESAASSCRLRPRPRTMKIVPASAPASSRHLKRTRCISFSTDSGFDDSMNSRNSLSASMVGQISFRV
jgi:hypothetical protein